MSTSTGGTTVVPAPQVPVTLAGILMVPPNTQVFARKMVVTATGQVVIPADAELVFA